MPSPVELRKHSHLEHQHTTPDRTFVYCIAPTMAAPRYCPSCLSQASPSTLFRSVRTAVPPPFLRQFSTTPSLAIRSSPAVAAAQSANAAKYKRKDQASTSKKKKSRTTYATPDLKHAIQFTLVDAMRYHYHMTWSSSREATLTRLKDIFAQQKSVALPIPPNTNCTSSSRHPKTAPWSATACASLTLSKQTCESA